MYDNDHPEKQYTKKTHFGAEIKPPSKAKLHTIAIAHEIADALSVMNASLATRKCLELFNAAKERVSDEYGMLTELHAEQRKADILTIAIYFAREAIQIAEMKHKIKMDNLFLEAIEQKAEPLTAEQTTWFAKLLADVAASKSKSKRGGELYTFTPEPRKQPSEAKSPEKSSRIQPTEKQELVGHPTGSDEVPF